VVDVGTESRLTAEQRAANWPTFDLLRTVIDQSPSSLRTEALIKLDQLEARVTEAEALGDA
jgi:hypothetical protein